MIETRICQHKSLMNEEVTLENITEDVLARQRDYERYEQQQEFEDLQNFRALLSELSPSLYDQELNTITCDQAPGSGLWLEENADFKKWVNPNNLSRRCLWLEGIPGSGKFVDIKWSSCLGSTVDNNDRENYG
jgi:hypothetical protein